jgi:chromate transporter
MVDALAGTHLQQTGWLHGLMIAAVAVVAQAVWSMARSLAPDRPRATIALAAAIVALSWQTALSQVLVIVAAGLVGWQFLPRAAPPSMSSGEQARIAISRGLAIAAWVVFFGLLLALPVLRHLTSNHAIAVVDSFFRVGALVFGGGHVVLPLLQREVVPPGWVTDAQFMAGYGAAQAVPGPLFTFAAYLGAVMHGTPHGWGGAVLTTVAIFAPSFLLLMGTLPFWDAFRARTDVRAALQGINAAVVGILLAALYTPVWTSAIKGAADVSLTIVALGLLMLWKRPPWLVVLVAALGGVALAVVH